MKIEYCRSKSLNFGDDLNLWLWPKLMGDIFDGEDDNVYFIGIGTVLTKKRIEQQLKDAKKIIIFSSGAWGDNVPELDERCCVYGVRGPRTAKKLGLGDDLIVGDGAYLLREVELPAVVKKYEVGFIPHHRSEDYVDWQEICKAANVKFISAKQPVDTFLDELRSCNKIVTEAMHGAIVADAMRVPWVAAKFSPLFNEEKWYDFAESMKIDLNIHLLPFYSQHKMRVGKLIENGIKIALSGFLKNEKWQSLLFLNRSASSHDLDTLSDKLRSIANNIEGCLSSDDVVNATSLKQLNVINKIIDDNK
jgi:succinoglycan biosynthesis protein ExoV